MRLKENIAESMGIRKKYDDLRIGIELEYERYNGRELPLGRLWNVVGDDSLRDGGIELVSRPLTQKDLPEALKVLPEAIQAGRLTPTLRCGVHAHLNAMNKTWGQLWSFIVLYTLMEPGIFAKFCPMRKLNHFCVPLFSNTALAEILHEDIQKLRTDPTAQKKVKKKKVPPPNPRRRAGQFYRVDLEGGRFAQPQQVERPRRRVDAYNPRIGGTSKYSALNFSRLYDIGTVEFRQFNGTADITKLEEWVRFLVSLYEEGTAYDDPLEVLAAYEDAGRRAMYKEFNIDYDFGGVDREDQDEAEVTASIMAGFIPPNWKELDWN